MSHTILIVDDSETSRLIIRKCLTMAGYEESVYLYAEDGIRALSVLADHLVDLVVTDLNMPRMDGITFLQKIRKGERTKTMSVLVISSMGNDSLEEQLRRLGVGAIVRKPVSPAKLRAALASEGGF